MTDKLENTADEPQKYYRCGWCGNPTDENGRCLSTKDIPIGDNDDWDNAELTCGDCCPNGHG